MVQKEILSLISHLANSWYPARELVANALHNRFDIDQSGAVFLLPGTGCPWGSHFHELERIQLEKEGMVPTEWNLDDPASVKNRPVFCVYKRKEGTWGGQAISLAESQPFSQR